MPIIDLQRRIAQAGRIRIGQQVQSGGKTRPAKLETFRLTSSDKRRIDHAAELYGGTTQEWQSPAGKEWEVVTQATVLPVLVPPNELAFSQWFETWSAGGCQRRCDGEHETISDGPCQCDPDRRQCQIHSRLSLMLRDLVGLGLWRVDSQGWYAATELGSAVEIVRMAGRRGELLPASLRLEQRMVKRSGKTFRFAVPCLDIEVSSGELMGRAAQLDRGTLSVGQLDGSAGWTQQAVDAPREIEAPQGNLTPVPNSVQERPVGSIKDQATAEVKSRRRKSTPSMPKTGIAPRTADAAAQGRSAAEVAKAVAPEPETPPDDAPPPEEAVHNVNAAEDPWGQAPPPPEGWVPPNERSQSEQPPDDDRPEGPPTAAMNRKMHACFRDLGVTDRDDRLEVTSFIVGRRLKSGKDMTFSDGKKVIDTAEAWISGDTKSFEEGIETAEDQINEILNRAALRDAQQQQEGK